MKDSNIKLGEAFNGMPGLEKIIDMLNEELDARYNLLNNSDFVDYPKEQFWINSEDTLVMRFRADCEMGIGARLAKFVDRAEADEFDAIYDGASDSYITRFWWD